MKAAQLERLHEHLQRLRLFKSRERLEAVLQEATAKELTYADFLDQVLTEEVASKTAKHVTMRPHLDSLGLRGVELVEADVNALDDASSLGGKFDLAHCRLLLMYQPDPAATLRRMSRLVRSGGRIVAVDFLRDPNYPRFHPPVPASERINHLFFALVERRGGAPDVAQQYRRLCEEANLRLIEQRGWFWVADDPGDLLALYRDAFVSMRPSLVAENLTTDEEINALVRETDTARCTTEFGAYVLMVAMIADVP